MDLLISAIFMLTGAVLGVILTLLVQKLQDVISCRNPLEIVTKRCQTPCNWYGTNLIDDPTVLQDHTLMENIYNSEPFCGFAKIDVRLHNKTNHPIYIENIEIQATKCQHSCKTLVTTVKQGGIAPSTMIANLDSPKPIFVNSLLDHADAGFFNKNWRIVIHPDETEIVELRFITIENAWRFNCRMHYSIGKHSKDATILPEDELIVPYLPETVENTYCGFFARLGEGGYTPSLQEEASAAGRLRALRASRSNSGSPLIEGLQNMAMK
ncbi:MAG: hypothetical protein Q4E12_07175 [Coriobacteriia bacterium]|nr:hypothetical protein [Coriobacteriia bacterium]